MRGLTSVVTRDWFGLRTGFLLGPADDKRVSPVHFLGLWNIMIRTLKQQDPGSALVHISLTLTAC